MRRRIEAILAVVAATIVFVVAGYVVSHHDRVPSAGATPGYSGGLGSARFPSQAPLSSSAATDSSGTTQSLDTVVFLGDEYTAGAGASSSAKGFAALTAAQLGVASNAVALPGGGYAKGSTGGRVYADRIGSVVKLRPEVVVVTGGRNDLSDDQATVEQAVAAFYSALHTALPKATLIAVTPFFGDSSAPAELGPIADAVKKAVTKAGGTYLDLADPLKGHADYMADSNDPNNKGYAAIAKALAPKLTSLLPGR